MWRHMFETSLIINNSVTVPEECSVGEGKKAKNWDMILSSLIKAIAYKEDK